MATKKDLSSFIWGKRTALETFTHKEKKKKGPPKRYGEHVESTILKKKNDVPHTDNIIRHTGPRSSCEKSEWRNTLKTFPKQSGSSMKKTH